MVNWPLVGRIGKGVLIATGALTLTYGGCKAGSYLTEPTDCYLKDLNNDRKTDLVIERRMGPDQVFMNTGDGRLESLEKHVRRYNRDIKRRR